MLPPFPFQPPPGALRLYALGRIDLRSSEGAALHSVLAQPKRLALLVYLSLARPRGFQRRDRLAALLWPETNAERARNSLSQALSSLRRSLGEAVLTARGTEEVALAEDALWCDAAAFADACASGRSEEAIPLYTGDLLVGFHLPDVHEFEQWLEAERERLRGGFRSVLEAEAERAEREGDVVRAVEGWRRLAEENRLSSRVALCLMRALDAAGDRAAAIQHARAHERLLREELQVEPDPEVATFAERLRQATPGTPPTPAELPVGGLSRPALAPPGDRDSQRAPASPVGGAGHRLGWAAPVLVVVLGGLLSLLPLQPGVGDRPVSTPSGVPASPSTANAMIAVLPFAVHGSPDTKYLGDAMVELLSTDLDGAGEIRTANPRSVLNVLRGGTRTPTEITVDIGERTAETFGADRFILGDLTVVGRQVRIRAELHRRGGAAPLTVAVVEGAMEDLFSLSDQLASRLLAGMLELPQRRISHAAALTAPSLPALRAYLEGERVFRAVEDEQVYVRATDAFQDAVAVDSTFALAQYRLAVAAHFLGRLDVAREATERAFRFREQLGARDQQLLAAWRAGQLGHAAEAERLYRELLQKYPDDPEAHFQLGDLLFRANPLRGRSRTEALDRLRLALRLDPRNGCARCQLLYLNLTVGEIAEADSLVTGFDPPLPLMERVIAAAVVARTGAPGAQQQLLERLPGVDPAELAYTVVLVASSEPNPPFLRRLFSLLTREEHAPQVRAVGEMLRVQLALREGKLREADRAMRRLQAVDPPLALALRGLRAAYPFRSLSPEELAELAVDLSGASELQLAPTLLFLTMDVVTLAHARQYLSGLVATAGQRPLRKGDDFAALSLPPFTSLARADLDARRLLAEDRPPEALVALEQAPSVLYEQWSDVSPLLSFTHTRYLQGELLLRAGREADALKWFRTIGEVPIPDWPYLAPATLRQAQIHERLGERDRAQRHYQRFIELWGDADMELQPLVGQAREALTRLAAARPSGPGAR